MGEFLIFKFKNYEKILRSYRKYEKGSLYFKIGKFEKKMYLLSHFTYYLQLLIDLIKFLIDLLN